MLWLHTIEFFFRSLNTFVKLLKNINYLLKTYQGLNPSYRFTVLMLYQLSHKAFPANCGLTKEGWLKVNLECSTAEKIQVFWPDNEDKQLQSILDCTAKYHAHYFIILKVLSLISLTASFISEDNVRTVSLPRGHPFQLWIYSEIL